MSITSTDPSAVISSHVQQAPLSDGSRRQDARRVPTDTTAKVLAGKTEPVESRSLLSRFTTRIVQLAGTFGAWVAGYFKTAQVSPKVQSPVPEQTFALSWLAGNRPLNLDNFKMLTVEGGELNLLYRGLECIAGDGSEHFVAQADELLAKEFRNVTARSWAAGAPAAKAVIAKSGEYTRISLAHELNQWSAQAHALVKAVNRSESLAAPVQDTLQPALAWLASGNSAGIFCELLNDLDHLSKSDEAWSNKRDAAMLLYQDVRGIPVRDWGCEQGSAKTWFTHASDEDKAVVAQALARWVDDAVRLIDGEASVRG